MRLAPFSHLCYGARFRYWDPTKSLLDHSNKQVYVKVGYNQVVFWDAANVATKWIGQPILCFNPHNLDEEVIIYE